MTHYIIWYWHQRVYGRPGQRNAIYKNVDILILTPDSLWAVWEDMRGLYIGLSENDYTLGYPRLTLDVSHNLTKRSCDSLQPNKASLLQPLKAWLLHMNWWWWLWCGEEWQMGTWRWRCVKEEEWVGKRGGGGGGGGCDGHAGGSVVDGMSGAHCEGWGSRAWWSDVLPEGIAGPQYLTFDVDLVQALPVSYRGPPLHKLLREKRPASYVGSWRRVAKAQDRTGTVTMVLCPRWR